MKLNGRVEREKPWFSPWIIVTPTLSSGLLTRPDVAPYHAGAPRPPRHERPGRVHEELSRGPHPIYRRGACATICGIALWYGRRGTAGRLSRALNEPRAAGNGAAAHRNE